MTKNFGSYLRKKREESGLGLNEVARRAQMSKTFLSLIERGLQPPPGIEKLQALARILNQQPDEFIALAGKLPPDVPAIIERHPLQFSALLRSMRKLSEDQLDSFLAQLGMAVEAKLTAEMSPLTRTNKTHQWLLFLNTEALRSLPASFDLKHLEPWTVSESTPVSEEQKEK